jgi:hypothetical protein
VPQAHGKPPLCGWGRTGMMLISQLQRVLPRRVLAVVLLLSAPAVLSGCASSIGGSVGDHLPTAAGGLPEGTPQRPATPAAYPAVHEMPPSRENQVLTYDEQKKLENDLIAARTRAAASGKATATGNPPAATGNAPNQ